MPATEPHGRTLGAGAPRRGARARVTTEPRSTFDPHQPTSRRRDQPTSRRRVMMRRLGLGILVATLVVILHQPTPVVGQTTAQDISKKTTEAWDTVKAYTAEKKNDAVAYGKTLVRDTDEKIKELEARAAKATGDAKALYDKEIKNLKAKRAQASQKLDEMGKASGAAWDIAKNGFADAYKDLHQAFERAAAQFK